MQRLAQQTARQHRMNVGQLQGLDLLEHGHAVDLATLQQAERVYSLRIGQCLHAVELANQLDEPGRQLLRPPIRFEQRLQRVIEVTSAMRPATDVHELVGQGYFVVDLLAVAHQHTALARADVQTLRGLGAA